MASNLPVRYKNGEEVGNVAMERLKASFGTLVAEVFTTFLEKPENALSRDGDSRGRAAAAADNDGPARKCLQSDELHDSSPPTLTPTPPSATNAAYGTRKRPREEVIIPQDSNPFAKSNTLNRSGRRKRRRVIRDDAYIPGYSGISKAVIDGVHEVTCMQILTKLKLADFANLPWGQRPGLDLSELRPFLDHKIWSREQSANAEALIEKIFCLPKGDSEMPQRISRGSKIHDPQFSRSDAKGNGGRQTYYKVEDCLDKEWQTVYEFLLPTFLCRLERTGLPAYFVYWLQNPELQRNYHQAFCYFFIREVRRLRNFAAKATRADVTTIFPHICIVLSHPAGRSLTRNHQAWERNRTTSENARQTGNDAELGSISRNASQERRSLGATTNASQRTTTTPTKKDNSNTPVALHPEPLAEAPSQDFYTAHRVEDLERTMLELQERVQELRASQASTLERQQRTEEEVKERLRKVDLALSDIADQNTAIISLLQKRATSHD